MIRLLKVLLPVLVLAASAWSAVALVNSRQPSPFQPPERQVPVVEVLVVQSEPCTLEIETQGELRAVQEVELVAEVTGRILELAPELETGAFFAGGALLARIDPTDYRLSLTRAQAEVAAAQAALALEEAEAAAAVSEWSQLTTAAPPPLATREPSLANARARLQAARAMVEQAERDLARTEIRAPFAGAVAARLASAEQYVARGTPLARVFATDFGEVRLPVTPQQAQVLAEGVLFRGEIPAAMQPRVSLRGDLDGAQVWPARVVRSEAALDPATRSLYLIARVERPFAAVAAGAGARPPLPLGVFLRATVEGRTLAAAWRVPRAALRDGDTLWLVDSQQQLRSRAVSVVHGGRDEVWIDAGLADGERVCLTALDVYSEGRKVQVAP